MKFCKLLQYDLRRGVIRNWIFLFVPVCVAIICISFRQSLLFWQTYGFQDVSASWALYVADFFKGLADVDRERGFQIPVLWMLGLLFPLFITLNYPFRDIKTIGVQLLLRSESRVGWWLAKCVWCLCCTVVYFLLTYGTVTVLCAVWDIPLTLEISGDSIIVLFADTGMMPDVQEVSAGQVILTVLVLPFLTVTALNMLELLLSLIIRPVYSFLACVSLVAASAYAKSPILFPNYANIARSGAFFVTGMDGRLGIAICLAVVVFSVAAGAAVFRRWDILPDYKEL